MIRDKRVTYFKLRGYRLEMARTILNRDGRCSCLKRDMFERGKVLYSPSDRAEYNPHTPLCVLFPCDNKKTVEPSSFPFSRRGSSPLFSRTLSTYIQALLIVNKYSTYRHHYSWSPISRTAVFRPSEKEAKTGNYSATSTVHSFELAIITANLPLYIHPSIHPPTLPDVFSPRIPIAPDIYIS